MWVAFVERAGDNSGVMWEQRWHPLREEWVIVAAHRQNRPWSGETVAGPPAPPPYDPRCFLCPGNERVSGGRNPRYEGIFIFDNDHPCVGPDAPPPEPILGNASGLYRVSRAEGIARVVCYSPRHDLSLSELSAGQIADLLRAWQEQYRELGARPEVAHVLTFENKGEAVGVSNPHPHCQIYATNFVFKTIENEARAASKYLRQSGRALLSDIIANERADGRRVLHDEDGAIAFVPYFARYAYEVFVAPTRVVPALADLESAEVEALARALKRTLVAFDNLWQMPFPYVMALHQAPTDGGDYAGFGFHIEFHPPLRKPNLLKFLAGPEIGGGSFVSDTLPEAKAAELRATQPTHYKAR